MEDRPLPTRLQHRIGILVAVMAGVIAITPLVLAITLRGSSRPILSGTFIAAAMLWLVAVATYRGLSLAHERWRRRMLRNEIADARNARIEASELFQDRLNEQYAILDRIRDISHGLLEEGILDPSVALSSITLINSHAFEAQGLVEDAVAEVRVETGSATFTLEDLDVRSEIEEVVAPFIRSGRTITTDGPQYFAHTDAAVFRLVLRGLATEAFESGSDTVDITLARDEDWVVCTVAFDGLDRSDQALEALPPVVKSLTYAVGGDLAYTRLLGRNQYSLSLPEGAATNSRFTAEPIDVLGTLPPRPAIDPETPAATRAAPPRSKDLAAFAKPPKRSRVKSVAARRESHVAAR